MTDLESDAMEVSEDAHSELSKAINELDSILDEIMRLELQLQEQNARLVRVKTVRLPAALEAARMKELKTLGGRTVTTKRIVSGTWPKTEQAVSNAVKWLQAENLLGLVKTTVVAEFDKGDHAEATRFFDEAKRLTNAAKSITKKESVHPQTLNAELRSRMERGLETPLELFNGYTATVADISEPGKRKK